MAVTIKQTEAAPASYPAVSGLSDKAQALDAAALWQRIEAFTAWRWTEREVVWLVEGDGDWCPPLAPAEVTAEEVWDGEAWVPATVYASPYGGYRLTTCGPFRFTAAVGGGEVPAAVSEAFRRLAEYSVEIGKDSLLSGHPAHTSHSAQIGQSVQETFDRPSTWAARAIHNSGAADLLRPYRRV